MKGYKGMEKDMTCRGMKYELEKTYRIDGEIKLCERGLHFCQSLRDVICYYPLDIGCRYFEVEASGKIIVDYNKCVASELNIVRELTVAEVNRILCGYGYGFGYDFGNGDGNGWGNGYNYDYSYGYDHGYKYGDGIDYGTGWGNGYGCGYGNAIDNGANNGHGNGHGNGNIHKILTYMGG